MTAFATALAALCADDRFDRLERFVGAALYSAGAWRSPRTSDGIEHCRFVQREDRCVRLAARIWEIDQTRHALWLEVHLDGDGGRWELRYDPDGPTSRRVRNAFDSIMAADEVEWSVTLSGQLIVDDGFLLPAAVEA